MLINHVQNLHSGTWNTFLTAHYFPKKYLSVSMEVSIVFLHLLLYTSWYAKIKCLRINFKISVQFFHQLWKIP